MALPCTGRGNHTPCASSRVVGGHAFVEESNGLGFRTARGGFTTGEQSNCKGCGDRDGEERFHVFVWFWIRDRIVATGVKQITAAKPLNFGATFSVRESLPEGGLVRRLAHRLLEPQHPVNSRALFFSLAILFIPHPEVSGANLGEIPVQSRGGYLWLDVRAVGARRPLHFVLDSGAASSVINLQTALSLGLPLGRPEAVKGVSSPGKAYRVSHFVAQSAGVTLPDTPLAMDFRASGISCDEPMDGLLGADFFRGRIVQIDFVARKIRLLDRAEPTAGCEILPIKLRNECLCVPLQIAGKSSQWMRVDTGCDSALEWFAGEAPSKRARETSIALANGTDHSIHLDVQLGTLKCRAVKTGIHNHEIFPGESGLLGNALLSKFKVTVDAKNGRLLLEPNRR
uniref:Peptidase A2 domain-containing protein n=1 Tax=uncultured Acidobacteria bacterium A11 TaxID=1036854 RepID=F8TTJ6_9BACT|nr:hypothetical protein [uncultured Acidobacteria bacterium A11]